VSQKVVQAFYTFWPEFPGFDATIANPAQYQENVTAPQYQSPPTDDSLYIQEQRAGYVYFKSNNGYQSRVLYTTTSSDGWTPPNATLCVGAMMQTPPTSTTAAVWLAKESFQVRCCGSDGLWWPNETDSSANPKGHNYWGNVLNDRAPTILGVTYKANAENADDLSTAWDGELSNNW
jgi:hypothetical protein